MRPSLQSFVSFLILTLLSGGAFAHTSTGHGKNWAEQKGPQGGALTSIVAASEAEMGEKAKTIAVAEWKEADGAIRLNFWDADRTKVLKIPEASTVKFIFIGSKLEKPIVESISTVKETDVLTFPLNRENVTAALPRVEHVEVILNGLESTSGKSVFIFPRKKEKL